MKLVRDKIINQIEKEGHTPTYHTVEGVDYALALMAKFREESEEFEHALANKHDRDCVLEEIADIITVLEAMARNVFNANIATVIEGKMNDCGGLNNGHILEKVA